MSIEDETPSRLEPPLGMADDDDPEIARVASVLAARLVGEPLEATRIGRFLVIDRIGAGGMGVVYSAFDPRLDRKVALKLLPARGSEQQEARLLTEAKALAKLSHPNVVAVFEVGEHGGGVFLAMEYVQGAR